MTTNIHPFARVAPADGSANIHHYINGQCHAGNSQASRRCLSIRRTGEFLAGSLSQPRRKLIWQFRRQSRAFPGWSSLPAVRRARILFRFRELVEKEKNRLAALISAEHGKVLDDAKGELVRGLEVVEFACGIPQLLKGEFSEQVSTDVDSFSFRQPLGVVCRNHSF